ncbi:MAG: ABC transporter permease [Acidobacteriota bacterium]
MNVVWDIVLLKWKLLLRQPGLFLLMMALPVLFTFIVGQTAPQGTSKIAVGLVIQDQHPNTDKVIEKLAADPVLKVVEITSEDAPELLRTNNVEVVFYLPQGFGECLDRDDNIIINEYKRIDTRETVAAESGFRNAVGKVDVNLRIARMTFQQIAAGKDVLGSRVKILNLSYGNADSRWSPSPPVKVSFETVGGAGTVAWGTTTQYGISFALFFAMFTIMGTVGRILEERETGTWSRLMAFPVSRMQFLGGHLLGTFSIGFLQTGSLVVIGKYLFGIQWGANIAAVMSIIAAFTVAVTAMGLLLSSFLKTYRQLSAAMPLLVVSTSMLGGMFWPLEIVNNKVLLLISNFVPQTWALQGLEGIVRYGYGFSSIAASIAVLLVMGVIFFFVSVLRLQQEPA